jgi:hypothetical protein
MKVSTKSMNEKKVHVYKIEPRHIKNISDVIIYSIKRIPEMQTLNQRSTCLALIYKDLIYEKVIPKDSFDCANNA